MDLITTKDEECKLEEGVIEAPNNNRRIYHQRRRHHSLRRDKAAAAEAQESKDESKFESKEDESSGDEEECKHRDTPRNNTNKAAALTSPSLRSFQYSSQLSCDNNVKPSGRKPQRPSIPSFMETYCYHNSPKNTIPMFRR